MPRKQKNIAELALLENEKPAILVEEEPEENIQASKEDEPVVPVKKTRPPKTPKQLEAFEITRQMGIEANKLRKIANEEKLKAKKEEKEEKIVKTAIIIKKKQIKRERILEVSDDEDTPVVVQRQKKVIPPPHQFVFV